MEEDTELAETLRGTHVVTLAPNVPGPVAAAALRALGARITKIEAPGGDPLATFAPGWYAKLQEGSALDVLDLKSQAGRNALEVHLAAADVLLTSSRPSALARLGLSWDGVHARHPGLNHVAIVGELPPHEERPGHDLTYVAQAGLLAPPAMPKTLLADLAGAERAVSATLALLLRRARGGGAGRAYVSLRAAAERFAAPLQHGITGTAGILGGSFGGYRLYRASDGWLAVGALEPHFWQRLCERLDVDRNQDCAGDRLAEVFARRGASDWHRWASENDVPMSAVP